MKEGMDIVKAGYEKTASGSILASNGSVHYEVKDRIARITFDRPEQRNSISTVMGTQLWKALLSFKDDPDAWICVISGKGGSFSSGHDLFEYVTPEDKVNSHPAWEEIYAIQRHIYKPIISMIDGPCLAQGAGIAILSDLRIMTRESVMGWPQVKRGITSMSGPLLLADLIPVPWALAYLMTGDRITSDEALRLNLVHEVVEKDDLEAATRRWIDTILANAPLAVSAMKEGVIRGRSVIFEERGVMLRPIAEAVKKSDDTAEGIRAFAEKRKPNWRRR